MAELYHDCCGHDAEFSIPDLADIDDVIERMVREVYGLQGTDGSINQSVAKFFADKIWGGVVKGYGNDLPGIDFDTPDYNMLKSLKENVWHFSSAKNYNQLRELSDGLLNEKGQLRSFEEFRDAAKAINDKFVKSWLRTEYNLAVSGGQMAGKWVDIERNASILPYLQFDVVMDGRTSEICKPLDGIIVPVTHPIVARYYPPNHFGCRTTIRQLASGVVTPDSKIALPEIPKMFQTNLGKQGLIFPEDHPYFIGIPNHVKDQLKP